MHDVVHAASSNSMLQLSLPVLTIITAFNHIRPWKWTLVHAQWLWLICAKWKLMRCCNLARSLPQGKQQQGSRLHARQQDSV